MAPFGGFFLWCASRLQLLPKEFDITEVLAFCFAILIIPLAVVVWTVNKLWLFFKWLDRKVGLRTIGLGFLAITLIGFYGLEKECGNYECLHTPGKQKSPLQPLYHQCESEVSLPIIKEFASATL